MASTTKLRELILYLALESEGDEHFGAIKLNKLLFYIDFESYRRFGKSVTGQVYQALPFGPAPRAVVPTLNSMEEKGEIAIRMEPLYGHTQKRPLALRHPALRLFSQEEVALAAHVLSRFWDMSATQVSELSHEFLGWSLAENF